MKRAVLGLLVAALVGCGMFSPSPAQVAEVTAVAQCEDYLRVLRKAKADGLTCEEGKAQAHSAEPHCELEFVCPVADAGVE